MLTGDRVRVRAPGKVNLALLAGGLRPDGYHELATVFQAVDLADELVLRRGERWEVSVPGHPELSGSDNLALRAARLLFDRATRDGRGDPRPVTISIAKQIPIAGGMAGGSADAAGALIGCNHLWGTGFSVDELAEIGGELGADIPFCVLGGTAVGRGRGEQLVPVLTRTKTSWVFAVAESGLATPAVFAEFDRLSGDRPPAVDEGRLHEVLLALRSGESAALAGALCNDLQAAAISLQPELRRTMHAGKEAGALACLVSGSGPTVAMLCDDAQAATEVAVALSASGTAATVRVGAGPVRGAQVVGR